jgi:4-aminobutyrate aminotransferase-like enzyme
VAEQLHSLAEQTDCVVNRMKEFGILMPADRTNNNIFKIKPPLTFTEENAKEVLFYLQKIFGEDFIKII